MHSYIHIGGKRREAEALAACNEWRSKKHTFDGGTQVEASRSFDASSGVSGLLTRQLQAYHQAGPGQRRSPANWALPLRRASGDG